MFVKPRKNFSRKANAMYSAALKKASRNIDVYGSEGMGDLADPLTNAVSNVKGQLKELRTGLTLAAAASTAAAIGVVLLLVSMPRSRK